MDLVSRLKHYLDYRQISVTQFADECAIPRPTGSQLLAGRNKKVSDEIIGKIHSAYPDLNIVWLMFGEGDMVTDSNIEISEPQKSEKDDTPDMQPPIHQPIDFEMDFNENPLGKMPEKIDRQPMANTFTFAATPETGETENPLSRHQDDTALPQSGEAEPYSAGKGKRVTGIVVYYDDCTYESFIPDPNHSHPFISR